MTQLPQWHSPYEKKTHHHLTSVVKFSPAAIKREMKQVEGFNAKLAVLITRGVGTMACAYVFAVIALLGLQPALATGGEGIIAWVAQTFLQLVLLSIIMVGQIVQAKASDARAEKQFADTEVIVDKLDEKTDGGLKAVLDAIAKLK